MKAILQTTPMVGSRKPYKRDEWIRTIDRGGYLEIEFPYPYQNRTGAPKAYNFLYLIPGAEYSFAFAYPFQGFHELIERIVSKNEYQTAFRQEWTRFDSMLVTDQQKFLGEITKRPLLVMFQDPEDNFKRKWVVATQILVQPGASNVISETELNGLESLILPTLGLYVEATDAVSRVGSGLIQGRYKFPKSGFEKFMEKYKKVQPYLDEIGGTLRDMNK